MYQQSVSQTVGPFFHHALISVGQNVLVNERTQGERIYIEGRVLDGDHLPVGDAMVEIWQADANGLFNHPADDRQAQADRHFAGFGRSDTVKNGLFIFKTIKPGIIPSATEAQAPYINVRVFARGMLIHAITRLYFADEPANESDTVLNLVPAERRNTLIATRDESQGTPIYRFDIVLQGEHETVFFNP